MFEELINDRVNSELSKLNYVTNVTLQDVAASDLSNFTKNFIAVEANTIKDREHFRELVEKSVKLGINYAIRPKWTLSNYLFGTLDAKPVEEVLEKIEIFQFYHYYIDLIYDYINEKSIVVITKNNTYKVLGEADKLLHEKLTKDITSVKIKNFLLQLFKLRYSDESAIGLESKIPFLFIRLFLEDKSFDEILNKFAVLSEISDSYLIDLKTIVKVLTNKIDIPEKPVPITADEEEVFKTDFEIKEKPDNLPEVPATTSEVKPVKKHIEEKIYEEDKAYPVEVIDHPIGFGTKHLNRLFKDYEYKSILKKVFRSNRDEMETALEELYNIDSWDNAKNYMKDIYIKNKVDLTNKYVILFTDVLFNYFSEKEESNHQ